MEENFCGVKSPWFHQKNRCEPYKFPYFCVLFFYKSQKPRDFGNYPLYGNLLPGLIKQPNSPYSTLALLAALLLSVLSNAISIRV